MNWSSPDAEAIQAFAKPSSSPYAALGELFGTQRCCSLFPAWRWNRPETCEINWDHMRWQWVRKNSASGIHWGCCSFKQIETLWAFLSGCTWRCLQNWNSKATDNYLGVRSQFRSNGCSWVPGWRNVYLRFRHLKVILDVLPTMLFWFQWRRMTCSLRALGP